MKSKNFSANGRKGFILISVLLMVVILLILMTSLIAITTQTLYRATLDMTRASLIVLSDSALTEVLILLTDDPLWGKNNEKLFMKTGTPNMKIAGFNPFALSAANSEFDFENNTAYYISFDPNDPAFATNKCFSVNNLDGHTPVAGWRPGKNVPPHTADIVITVMEDDVVRHVEVFIMKEYAGDFHNGSRGKARITTNYFTMDSKYGSTSFHSNYDDVSSFDDVSVDFFDYDKDNPLSPALEIYIPDGTLSACSKIEIDGSPADPDSDIYQVDQEPKEIPDISISTIVSDITFEPVKLPSGTYKVENTVAGFKLEITSDISGDVIEFSEGDEIIPGVKFEFDGHTQCGTLVVSKNIQVAYDADKETGSGNFIMTKGGPSYDVALKLEEGVNFYAPGLGIKDSAVSDDPTGEQSGIIAFDHYTTGNINIGRSYGNGNIYAMGTINMAFGEVGDTTPAEVNIALYSEGDIRITAFAKMTFNGLVYTRGDFKSKAYDLDINGALIAAGKDSDSDPYDSDPGNIEITSNRVSITFDDTVLETINKYSGGGGGGSVRYRRVCWYEF